MDTTQQSVREEIARRMLRTTRIGPTAVARYVAEELGGLEQQTERFRYLFRRLLRSVQAVVDNVAQELCASRFRPISFELGFGSRGELPPVELTAEGVTISVSGFVDRVDGWVENGRLHLRVVDYKSGRKAFDLSAVKMGLDIQMLLYLFTLEKHGAERYGKEIVPAVFISSHPALDVVRVDKPVRLACVARRAGEHEVEKPRVAVARKGKKMVDLCFARINTFAAVKTARLSFA